MPVFLMNSLRRIHKQQVAKGDSVTFILNHNPTLSRSHKPFQFLLVKTVPLLNFSLIPRIIKNKHRQLLHLCNNILFSIMSLKRDNEFPLFVTNDWAIKPAETNNLTNDNNIGFNSTFSFSMTIRNGNVFSCNPFIKSPRIINTIFVESIKISEKIEVTQSRIDIVKASRRNLCSILV